nr:MAG TPA: hypothetical protein [Caudoviricetes sp.]
MVLVYTFFSILILISYYPRSRINYVIFYLVFYAKTLSPHYNL